MSFDFLSFLISNNGPWADLALLFCPSFLFFPEHHASHFEAPFTPSVWFIVQMPIAWPTETVPINLVSLGRKAYLGKENGPLYCNRIISVCVSNRHYCILALPHCSPERGGVSRVWWSNHHRWPVAGEGHWLLLSCKVKGRRWRLPVVGTLCSAKLIPPKQKHLVFVVRSLNRCSVFTEKETLGVWIVFLTRVMWL